MVYALLADLTLALHLAFILFVVFGAIAVGRRPWIAVPHLLSAAWAAFVEFSGRICPLTPLENWFERRAGGAGYSGGFIDHYLVAIVYPRGLTRDVQWILGALVVVLNVAAYAWLLRRRRRRTITDMSPADPSPPRPGLAP
jgi:Protein of Unknown function (DUF2784)